MPRLTRRQLAFGASGLAVGLRPGRAHADMPDVVIGLVIGTPRSGDQLPPNDQTLHGTIRRTQQTNIGASLRAGLELAIADINAKGGVLGRKFRLAVEELDLSQHDQRKQGIEAARRLVKQPGLIASIGHVTAEDALPASITYAMHGILFITPTIALGDLNSHGLTNVFATIPDNADISSQTATFASGQGLSRIAVIRSRDATAEEQTIGFLDQASTLGMIETVQTSYPAGRTDFRDLLADLRAAPFDTLFIAAPATDAATIIRQGYELQMAVTYVLGGLSDLAVLAPSTAAIPSAVIVPVLENASVDTPEQKAFDRHFREQTGHDADDWVWQGYDVANLLAATIIETASFDPSALIATLRYAMAWPGLMGRYSFQRNGRIYTRLVSFVQLQNSEISYFSLTS